MRRASPPARPASAESPPEGDAHAGRGAPAPSAATAANGAAEGERAQVFRALVENLDRIFWVITPDLTRIIYVSPACERVLGRTRASIYANPMSWIEAMHPHDRSQVLDAINRRVRGLPVPDHQVFRVTRPDGGTRWLRSQGLLVPAPDGGWWYIGVAEDITELKRDADAEGERASMFRMMTEQLPAVIWTMGRDLVFTSSNGRGLVALGRVPNEVVGMTIWEYFGTDDPDFPPIAAHRRALTGEKVSYDSEWQGRTFTSHLESLCDPAGRVVGVLGLALDVTERRQAEVEARAAHEALRLAHESLRRAHDDLGHINEELESRILERTAALQLANERLEREAGERLRVEESLRRSVELYRLLAENTSDLITRLAADGICTYVSPAIYGMAGYAPEDLLGRSGYDVVHPDDLETVVRASEEVVSRSGTATVIFRFRMKSGSYKWVEAIGKRVEAAAGEAGEMIIVVRDISQRKQTEERVARLQRELAQVARLSTIGEMASQLAHELNQPLTAVMNYLDAGRRLLRRDCTASPEALAAMDEAAAEAQRAGHILQRVRSFARGGEPERTLHDVNTLVNEVLELAHADIRAREVKLDLDLASDLSLVRVDGVQIQQVILNLIRNGLDAMADGDGERRLSLRTRQSERSVAVEVGDTGPGIPADVRTRLFEPFFTMKPGGMGLGLSISHSIVEAAGGRLWAEEGEGPGATFCFSLPAAAGKRSREDA